LSASLDYFDIKVGGAITNIRGAAATLCDAGNALACSFFTFDPDTGAPTSMSVPALNLSNLQYVGYDFALQYHTGLGDFLPGTFDVSWNATYMDKAKIDLGAGSGPVNRAGENGGVNTGAIARLTSVLSGTYSHGGSSITAQLRYISKGKIDNTFDTLPSNRISNNRVPSVVYLNLYGTLALDKAGGTSLFMSIENVLDKDPPVVPYPALFTATNAQYYDVVGRYFRVGAKLKF